jgi:hypothetical protein
MLTVSPEHAGMRLPAKEDFPCDGLHLPAVAAAQTSELANAPIYVTPVVTQERRG